MKIVSLYALFAMLSIACRVEIVNQETQSLTDSSSGSQDGTNAEDESTDSDTDSDRATDNTLVNDTSTSSDAINTTDIIDTDSDHDTAMDDTEYSIFDTDSSPVDTSEYNILNCGQNEIMDNTSSPPLCVCNKGYMLINGMCTFCSEGTPCGCDAGYLYFSETGCVANCDPDTTVRSNEPPYDCHCLNDTASTPVINEGLFQCVEQQDTTGGEPDTYYVVFNGMIYIGKTYIGKAHWKHIPDVLSIDCGQDIDAATQTLADQVTECNATCVWSAEEYCPEEVEHHFYWSDLDARKDCSYCDSFTISDTVPPEPSSDTDEYAECTQ